MDMSRPVLPSWLVVWVRSGGYRRCAEALDTGGTQAVGSGEGGGGGTVAVGGDQVGDVALIEAVVQAPRTLRARSWGTHRAW